MSKDVIKNLNDLIEYKNDIIGELESYDLNKKEKNKNCKNGF